MLKTNESVGLITTDTDLPTTNQAEKQIKSVRLVYRFLGIQRLTYFIQKRLDAQGLFKPRALITREECII